MEGRISTLHCHFATVELDSQVAVLGSIVRLTSILMAVDVFKAKHNWSVVFSTILYCCITNPTETPERGKFHSNIVQPVQLISLRSESIMVMVVSGCVITARCMLEDVSCSWKVSTGSGT